MELVRCVTSRLVRSRHLAVLALAVIAIYGGIPTLGFAQLNVVEKPQPLSGPNNLFFQDRDLNRPITKASQEIRDGNVASGLELLQYAIDQLESRGDSFYRLPDTNRFVSLKQHAHGLIAGLPKNGRASYERQFGITATHDYEDAVRAGDVTKISSVVSRYQHTNAGREAAVWLGAYALNRDDPMTAAMYFDLVRESPDLPQKWAVRLPVVSALAWYRADQIDHAIKILNTVARENEAISFGGRDVDLLEPGFDEDAAKDWLAGISRVTEVGQPSEDYWFTLGGNPARTGESRDGLPIWDSKWIFTPHENLGVHASDEDAKSLAKVGADTLKKVREKFEAGELVTLPAGIPLLVHDPRKDRDLAVFKAFGSLKAVNARTGDFVWESIHTDEDLWKVLRGTTTSTNSRTTNTTNATMREMYFAQRAFRDTTAGTISSDGRIIFSVEDNGFFNRYSSVTRGVTHPLAPKSSNSLIFVEAKSGRLKHGFGRGEEEWELQDHFFMGAPLVLGDHLYCIAEASGEVRLLGMKLNYSARNTSEPDYSANVEFSQPLVRPSEDINMHPSRRTSGVTPSYADGVLICQTTAGAVVGYDLKRRSLMWGYQYGSRYQTDDTNPRAAMMRRANSKSRLNQPEDEGRWTTATSAIWKGRVVLTPRDSDELHCIDLLTGEAVWRRPRSNGLYLAGIHDGNAVVVSTSGVEAISVETGKPAWANPIPTGMPSGHGCRSGDRYFLPLGEKRIAVIDLGAGRLLAELPALNGRQAGNLVASNGVVVSQSLDGISAFLPNGGTAIAGGENKEAEKLRGGLIQIANGNVDAGMQLVRASADSGFEPSQRVVVKAFLEGMRLDFAAHQADIKNVKPWIRDPLDKAEFHRLYAVGLHQAGESVKSAEQLLALIEVDEKLPLQRINSNRNVRSDRWIRSRLNEIYTDITPEQRVEVDKLIAQRMADADKPEERRRLASSIVGLPQATDAIRRVIEVSDPKDLLKLEGQLMLLSRSEDQATAAESSAKLATLMVDSGRFNRASTQLSRIESEWADTIVDAEKKLTGKQFVAATLAAIAKNAPETLAWPESAAMKVSDTKQTASISHRYIIDKQGPEGQFADWTFSLDSSRTHIMAHDGFGNERWKLPLGPVGKQVRSTYGNSIFMKGDVLVALLSSFFVVMDTSHPKTPKVLWSRHLHDERTGDPNTVRINFQRVMVGGAWQVRALGPDGNPFGTVGAITANQLCYQVGKSVFAADLLTGDVLWERKNAQRGCAILGDHKRVTLIAPNVFSGIVLDAADGRELQSVTIPKGDRIATNGRYLVTTDKTANPLKLQMTDASNGKVLWKRDIAAAAKTYTIEGEEIAILYPHGKFEVVDIKTGEARFETQLNDSAKVQRFQVRRSDDQYVILTYETEQAVNGMNVFGFASNHFRVNGFAYALDRKTGEQRWATRIERQSVDPGQPENCPVLVLTVRSYQFVRAPGQRPINKSQAQLLDLRSGKIVYDSDKANPDAAKNTTRSTTFYPYQFAASVSNRTITITFATRQQLKVTFDES